MFLFLMVPTTLTSQIKSVDTIYIYTLPPNAAAVTECLGGRTRTMLDDAIIDTDTTEEIRAHERKHREQYESRLGCQLPDSISPATTLLYDEIDAYCTSLPYAEKRGIPRAVRMGEYFGKIYRQFGGRIVLQEIIFQWYRRCPAIDKSRP